MGVFNPSVITDKGREYINRATHNSITSLRFTKVELSDIRPTGDLSTLTKIEGVRQTANHQYEDVEKGSYIVNASVSNENLTEGYYIRTIGLYAIDYPYGEEILFSVTTANEDISAPDWMPPISNAGVTSICLRLSTGISNTENVSVTTNPAGLVTEQQFKDLENTIENTIILAENKTVYVAGGGEDENGDLYTVGDDVSGDGTQDKPYKTIQKAIDMCPTNTNGYTYTIKLYEGTYDEEIIISDKVGTIQLIGTATLADSTKYKIRSIYSRNSTHVVITGVSFTGTYNQYSNVGVAGTNTMLNLNYCKFNDCLIEAGAKAVINLIECELSNYRSGSVNYGVIHANGGKITCYGISGTNNKGGYGGGVNSAKGGDIYVYSNCTLEADTLILEDVLGQVHYNTGRYTLIGSTTGTTSIPINSELYTEFYVIQRYGDEAVTYHIISPLLTDTPTEMGAGFRYNDSRGMAGIISVSNSSISQVAFKNDAHAVTSVESVDLLVYAKR